MKIMTVTIDEKGDADGCCTNPEHALCQSYLEIVKALVGLEIEGQKARKAKIA